MNRIICLTLLSLTSITASLAAQGVEQADFQRRQQAQQRARVMTQELISGILDIQIRQLEENQLTSLPVYDDIKTMRANVDQLVENEMGSIVKLLAEAQSGTQSQRIEKFNLARDSIREVVLALMAERQRLYKRLQIARLAAQTREIIALQQKTKVATSGLTDQPLQQRESLAIAVIQDQRDVNGLFLQLVDTLNEVGQWSGRVGSGAIDGLRILKAAEVGIHLDNTLQSVSTGRFDNAAGSQKSTIQGLLKLLEKLEETRGIIGADREAAKKLVREITKKQEELREKTKKTDIAQETPGELTEAQEEIHKDLGKLAENLQAQEELQPLLEQSKLAAHEAIADLFEGDQENALEDQNKVLGALAELEHQLETGSAEKSTDQSADSLADRIEKLEKAQEKLHQLAKQQDEAEKSLDNNPKESASKSADTAKKLEELTHEEALPTPVLSRIANAQELTEEAAIETANAKEPEAIESAQDALEQASEAIERAESELAAQIADAKREQLAVEVGELARAAEALERAAAAQQEIANTIADQQEQTPEEIQNLIDTEKSIEDIAQDIAKGVEKTSPETNEILNQASSPIQEAKNALEKSKDQPDKEEANQQLAKANQQANKAADQLKKAATQLRKDAGKAASELANIADKQLAEVQQTKSAVEDAIEKGKNSLQQDIANLQEANKNIDNAKANQQTAAGNEEAAQAQKLANEISKLQNEQSEANKEADALKQGKSNSPLNAAAQQQKVADETELLAKNAPSPISEALDDAKKAAAEAAKQTLDGDPNLAEDARQAVNAALETAKQEAEKLANQKVDSTQGEQSREAQQQVSDTIEEAMKLANQAAPEAGESLNQAKEQSNDASENIAQGEKTDAGKNQQAAMDALNKAQDQVNEALKEATEAAAEQLAQQAEELGQLAEESSQVDPNATAALRQAEKAASNLDPTQPEMNNQQPSSPEQVSQAAEDAQKSLQQAAAALTAREQQIAKDKAIAETLADLAVEQQVARDDIDKAAEKLEQLATNAKPPAYDMKNHPETGSETPATPENPGAQPMPMDPSTQSGEATDPMGQTSPMESPSGTQPSSETPMATPSPEQLSAAQQLAEATQRFAEAQQATGEGAVEISNQVEVANLPIREGLEAASELPLPGDLMEGQIPESETGLAEAGTPMGEPGQAAPTENQTAQPGQAPMGSELAQGQSTPSGTPQSSAPAGSTPPSNAPMGQQPGQSSELGTGFVPESPLATAQAIAGPEAMQQAQQALAAQAAAEQAAAQQASANNPTAAQAQAGPMSTPDPSAQATVTPQTPMQGTTSALAQVGGTSEGGSESENQLRADSALELQPETRGGDSRSSLSGEDSDATQQKFVKSPWFAKLPPDLQKAIQASARRPAPRGYEERLRRYFENID